MAGRLFLQPHLAPTIKKLEGYEFAKIWASASSHLSLQLALHQTSSLPPSPLFQAVRIPGIGTFAVVTKRVALSEQDLVIVERPVFQLEQAVAQDHELRCGCIDIPGRQDFEQLPFAQIASENAVSEGTVQLYMKRTAHLFHACLENRENVAIIWRDVGMLIVQGKDVKMRFYLDFLERLNGSGKMLQALLEMPEMRDSVISRHDTAASQTSSGRVMVLPWYQLETVPKMPTLIDLPGRVQAKEDVAEKRLLRRARLSPNRLPALPVKPEQGQKAEGSEPRARQLPAVQRSCLKEKEEKGKLPPLVGPGTVDFIARAMERREKESSSSECSSDSSPSSVESDESSCDLLEIRTIMENWEEAGEEPPTVPEDNSVPPKRSLSPRTDRALREVVTCILGQVARKRRGERDEQLDLQDKLQCKTEQKRSSGTAKGLEKRAGATGGPATELEAAESQTDLEAGISETMEAAKAAVQCSRLWDDSLLSQGVEEKLQYLGQKLQYLAQRVAHLPLTVTSPMRAT
ncbi:hypothetical protein Q9233_006869, partial [Columba guinea]